MVQVLRYVEEQQLLLVDFMIMKFKPIRSSYNPEYSGVPRIP